MDSIATGISEEESNPRSHIHSASWGLISARAMAEKHVFEQVSMHAGHSLPVRIIVAIGMRGNAGIN